MLNSTASNCGPPFGTKRPQVQILSPRPVFPQARSPHQKWCGPLLLRGAPKRNAEGTPPRVLSKHGSDLVLVRDEEAAGFRFCHPDHSPRSLTCGNAVSWPRCSIPQRSPQRPRGNKWNAGATATGRTTPSRPARRSRPRGTAGSLQGTVILRQQRRGLSGRDFRQPGITDDPKQRARPAQDRRRAPPRR